MAKIKKDAKDGEQRITLTVTDKELWETAHLAALDMESRNKDLRAAYYKATELVGTAAGSMFVEPIDEKKSRCYVLDKDGKRQDLGEIPTLAGLDELKELRLSAVEQELKRLEKEDQERKKLLAGSLAAIDLSHIGNGLESAAKQMSESIATPISETVQKWIDFTDQLLEPMRKNMEGYFKQLSDMISALSEVITSNPAFARYAEELDKLSKDPEYKDADVFRSGLDYEDEEETILADTLHNKALMLAMERAKVAEEQETQEKQEKQDKNENSPVIKVQRTESVSTQIPIDKINNTVWKMIERATPNGQMMFDFVTGKPIKKGQRVIDPLVMYSLDFDKIEKAAPETTQIVKHLTPYDKRVMVAVAALYNAGNEYFTITDIWHKMGNAQEKRPAKIDFEKINNSLKKQSYAHLVLNNMGEQKADYNYPKFHYEGDLLQFEKVTAEIDGQPIESAIHLFREPPLISFARDRKQITTVKNAVLESPVSKTEQNLQIDDYLIERIAVMKREATISRKILYKSLFNDCNITRNQNRAKETIERYLKHYKATEFIKDFQAQGDCIIITP